MFNFVMFSGKCFLDQNFFRQTTKYLFLSVNCKGNKWKAETFSQNTLIAIRAFGANFLVQNCEDKELFQQNLIIQVP